MTNEGLELAYTVELEPGEKLSLPASLVERVGPGRWVLTVRPWTDASQPAVRRHTAFLESYDARDEGLYDDLGG